jgi:hypothetical protein
MNAPRIEIDRQPRIGEEIFLRASQAGFAKISRLFA